MFQNLTELNVQLEDEITKLKKEMQEGQLEIEKTTDEYLKLKVCIFYFIIYQLLI